MTKDCLSWEKSERDKKNLKKSLLECLIPLSLVRKSNLSTRLYWTWL